jgi:hypothetical protein
VPDVAEVDLQLTGEEELVGRREDGDRTALAPGDGEPVACPQDVESPGLAAGSVVHTGSVTTVTPDDLRERLRREPLQPALVDVGHRGLVRLGDDLDP